MRSVAGCSTFGGLIPTPRLDRLASAGLRYNAFHTTAMCSPTRAALLTGRNHHCVGFGAISQFSIDAPGYTSALPRSAATIARILRNSGYDTAMFGKNHNTPEWELGPLGPFDRWPTGLGFNYFYGFNGGMIDQFTPSLVENINSVRPPVQEGYHLDRDLADHAINWFQVQKALRPDHPFFIYWAPGTLHEPNQAPQEWLDRFRGHYAEGWDAWRESTFQKQKALGIIPQDARLTPRPDYIPAWDSLSSDEKRLFERQMEAAAAQLAHFDHQFGRMIDALDAQDQLNNTLVMFIQGDNGAVQEYRHGNTNYDIWGLGLAETPAEMLPKIDRIGSPDHNGVYHLGWGWAMTTPFAESKQVASHLGGIRNGLVVSWPDRIPARGEVRPQFAHVIDIAPTIYEVAGVTPPTEVDGVTQQPVEGISLVYTFDAPEMPSRREEQYFEMLGNRALYQRGWMASTLPEVPPYVAGDDNDLDPTTYDWALYDLVHDWSQSQDISEDYRGRLVALRDRFEEIAREKHLHPIVNKQMERQWGKFKPSALSGAGPRRYPAGSTRYRGPFFPAMRRGWKGIATVDMANASASGAIFTTGSRFSGASFLVEKGIPILVICPTRDDRGRRMLRSDVSLQAGENTVELSIDTDTPPTATLTVNGRDAGSVEIDMFPAPVAPETFIGEYAIDNLDMTNEPGMTVRVFTVGLLNIQFRHSLEEDALTLIFFRACGTEGLGTIAPQTGLPQSGKALRAAGSMRFRLSDAIEEARGRAQKDRLT